MSEAETVKYSFKFKNPFSKMSKMLISFVRGGGSRNSSCDTNEKLAAMKSTIQIQDASRTKNRQAREIGSIGNKLPSVSRFSGGGTSRSTGSGFSVSRRLFGVAPIEDTSTPTTSTSSSSSSSSSSSVLCCDKCDGKHETENCPYYKKKRDSHPDAQKNLKKLGGTSTLPGALLKDARVVRQPGDGSCLFHSLSFGLKDGTNAGRLRAELCAFIKRNGSLQISDTPISDWVKWDSGASVSEYASRMSGSAWGGGIEMASLSKMKQVNVHVYERTVMGNYKRISAFDCEECPQDKKTVSYCYQVLIQ